MWPRLWLQAKNITQILAGQRCQICGQAKSPDSDIPLCPACIAMLPLRQGGYCSCCGQFYSNSSATPYPCLACRSTPPPWARLGFYGPYAGVLQELVHRNKFGHDLGLERLFRFLLIQVWEKHDLSRPDVLVPVPMRPRSVLRRGFNQSMELARILSREFQVPLEPLGLMKIRNTQAQSTLGRKARLSNVRGAFQAHSSLQGKRVLLVDDVITTGATLRACTKACLQAGADQVEVLVLAKAL